MPLVRTFAAFAASLMLAAAALAAAPKAPPAPPTLDAYFGDWQGTATAMSETDEDFPTSKRDIAVTINKTDLGGFMLSWSTLQRQKGDPKAPLEVLKSTTVEFVPAPAPNTWRARAETDPYTGGILYWARLDGRGLVVSSFTINPDGRPEYQTYARRVTGKEMKLEFSNVSDGKFVRSVKGTLRKLKGR
jgi:hypothetical protein